MPELDAMALAGKMTIGTVFGACAGTAVKRLSKDAMYGAGVALIGLQALAHYGWIEIHWRKIGQDIEKAADLDGDGKFGFSDIKILLQRTVKFLGNGVPDAAGFTAGFYGALKWA